MIKLTTEQKKAQLKDEMLKISSTIGMYEIQRQSGTYVSINEIFKLRKQFKVLSDKYSRLSKKEYKFSNAL